MELAGFGNLVLEAQNWLLANVVTLNMALQIALVLAAFAAAWGISKPLKGRIAAFVIKHTDDDDPWLRRLGRKLDGLMIAIIWVALQWMLNLIMSGTGQPHDFMRMTASLLNAWILIHLVSSFVVNPFWSKTFAFFAWSIAALNVVNLLKPAKELLDSVSFTLGAVRLSPYLILKGTMLAAILLWIAFSLTRLLQKRIQKAKNLTPSMQVLIVKIAKVVFIVMAVVIALNAIGVNLTALTVFGGALGIGIGFGLQKIVSNFVSGIIVLMDRSIRPGDVIEVGGTYGTVKSLGARYTSVVTRDGTEFLIPNEQLIAEQVINWSYSDTNVRRKIPIGISYGSDMEQARELVLEAANETERILGDPAPRCHLIGFGDNSIDLQARFWLADPHNGVKNVQSDFLRIVWKKFKDNNIEFPYPQRDIHIRDGGAIRVILREE